MKKVFKTMAFTLLGLVLSVNLWGATSGDVFSKITKVSDLADGDEIIFVNSDGTSAMSTTQNANNRGSVTITTTKNGRWTYSTETSDVQILTVKVVDGKYGFHTGSGYLYSASTSSNYLKTTTTAITTDPTGTSLWSLSIAESGNTNQTVTIQNGTNTAYYIQWNGTTVSQYKNTQVNGCIYKKIPVIPVTSLDLWEAGEKRSVLNGQNVGDTYELPSSDATCGDKEFVGWSSVEIKTPGNKPTSNFYEPGDEVTLAANNTFYAVFADEGEGGGAETKSYGWEDDMSSTDWEKSNLDDGKAYDSYKHAGSYAGSTQGKGSAYIKTKNKIASPTSATCYYTKASNNTNNSSKFIIQISTNGTDWTDASTGKTMNDVTQGTFEELKADLSTYSNVYIRFYYTGTTATRVLDDISITYAGGATYSNYTTSCAAAANPTITANTEAEVYWEPITVTLACETEGAAIYYTTNGDVPTVASTLYEAPFQVSATTTVKAIAVKEGLGNSEVASKTFSFGKEFDNIAACFADETLQNGDVVKISNVSAVITGFAGSGKTVYFEGGSFYVNETYPQTYAIGGTLSGSNLQFTYMNDDPKQLCPASWDAFTYTAPGSPTGVNNVKANKVATKAIVNGHIMIIRDNKTYNVLGF